MTYDSESVKAHLESKFIKSEQIFNALDTAMTTEQNIIVFGPGGHGKSEIAIEFFKAQGIEPFVQACGGGTTEEKLFGGVNVKKLTESGVIEYLVEHSFMNHEYVILEELFDTPIKTLTSLKDILTSGEFRNGSQQFKIKTKLIIVNTNRARHEVVEDDSHKALMERFPLGYRLVWDSYEAEDFRELFEKVYSEDFSTLPELIANMVHKGHAVSPRIALKMAKVFKMKGISGLQFIDGIPDNMLDFFQKEYVRVKVNKEKNIKFDKLKEAIENIENLIEEQKNENDTDTLIRNHITLGFLAQKLIDVKVSDDRKQELKALTEMVMEKCEFYATIALENNQPKVAKIRLIRKIFEDYEQQTNQSS